MIEPVADGNRGSSVSRRGRAQLSIYGMSYAVDPNELQWMAPKLRAVALMIRVALEVARRAAWAIEPAATGHPLGLRAFAATRDTVWRRSRLRDDLLGFADEVDIAWQRYAEADEAARNRAVVRSEALLRGPMIAGIDAFRLLPLVSPVGALLWRDPGRRFVLRVGAATTVTVFESLSNNRWTPSDAQMGYWLEQVSAAWLDLTGRRGEGEALPQFASIVVPALTGDVSTRVRSEVVPPPVQRDHHRAGLPAVRRPPGRPEPTTSVTGIIRNIEDLNPAHGNVERGTVRVDRVVARDGSVSWIVYIPATQSRFSPWGQDGPTDWTSNLQTYGGVGSAASNAVLQAMRLAGIGRGEPVLLAGHSQGGLMATHLASRPEVRAEFDVGSVLTFGSPVGHIDLPDNVAALHVDHHDDLTSGLDNRLNPVGPNRTTVTRDVTRHDVEPGRWGHVGIAHDSPAYEVTAEQIDVSQDPAIQQWMEHNSAMLDPRAEVHSTYVRSTREP